MTKLYIDENISYHIANGLSKLEKGNGNDIEVLTIKDEFGRGANDEDWIPLVGKESGVVITQDFNIYRKKLQRDLFENHGVGLFIIRPPSKKHGYRYWEMVQQIINHWPEIKDLVQNKRPFAFYATANGKFERL